MKMQETPQLHSSQFLFWFHYEVAVVARNYAVVEGFVPVERLAAAAPTVLLSLPPQFQK